MVKNTSNNKDNHLLSLDKICNLIYLINGQQVILDRDLAILYQTDTRTLKQAVRRNAERFPFDFMFELTDSQINEMVSQFVIPSKSYFGGAKPYVFTEQGVAMLSAVLRTTIAVEISVQIIRAFVEMRKILYRNTLIMERLENIELKQFESDKKFEQVFKALEQRNAKPLQGVFFKDTVFDAYSFVSELIRFEFKEAHDRFLILDKTELYHFGASLKDLGKKWFAFSKMDSFINEVLSKLGVECKNER